MENCVNLQKGIRAVYLSDRSIVRSFSVMYPSGYIESEPFKYNQKLYVDHETFAGLDKIYEICRECRTHIISMETLKTEDGTISIEICQNPNCSNKYDRT